MAAAQESRLRSEGSGQVVPVTCLSAIHTHFFPFSFILTALRFTEINPSASNLLHPSKLWPILTFTAEQFQVLPTDAVVFNLQG